jgi:hypothetical protein
MLALFGLADDGRAVDRVEGIGHDVPPELDEATADELTCSICSGLFCEPLRVKTCGHKFCSMCVLKPLAEGNPCPFCRGPLDDLEVDAALQRRVLTVLVMYATAKRAKQARRQQRRA